VRYGVVKDKIQREIVLLKGNPCVWGKCTFCDYTDDNIFGDLSEALRVNHAALSLVSGIYGRLEVVNSGSVFELPNETLELIHKVSSEKNIHALYFEASWMYRSKIRALRQEFERQELFFKCGVETFDDDFRNNVMLKGIYIDHPRDIAEYFDSVCLLVGMLGQTREMVKRDIDILTTYFKMGCVNIFMENSTNIKADYDLIGWFKDTYGRMEDYPGIDCLWENTDFDVGSSN